MRWLNSSRALRLCDRLASSALTGSISPAAKLAVGTQVQQTVPADVHEYDQWGLLARVPRHDIHHPGHRVGGFRGGQNALGLTEEHAGRNEVSWSMSIGSKVPSACMALASGPALWCRSPPAYTGGGT